VIPNLLARAARFSASFSASVCLIPMAKSCFGASSAAEAGAGFAATGSAEAAPPIEDGASFPPVTFRSFVLAGSTSSFWLGTATGLATWLLPPAVIAAAAGAVVALPSSSSQSISSSAAGAEAAAGTFRGQ